MTEGKIETNTMATENVYIEPNHETPGILVTGAFVTFNCIGFGKKTVTGNIIAHISAPNCGSFQSTHTVTFPTIGAGQQQYRQVTTSGTQYDLISNPDDGSTYLTTAYLGTLTTSYSGNKVKLTC